MPYIGYPRSLNAIACINKAVEASKETDLDHTVKTVFPMGAPNQAYEKYFVGRSFFNMLTTEGVSIGNVTFEPGCRNNWHIHKAEKGGGQILLCTDGHWHGAARDSWFTHLSVEVPGENTGNEWLEPVEGASYDALK